MAAELKALGIVAQLIGGEKGVFDVIQNGKTVFSKHSVGRFPNPNEVSELINRSG